MAPAWAALAGATVLAIRNLARRRTSAVAIVRAANVPFLVFVLALGVVVQAVMRNGVAERMGALLPSGSGLAALLGFAILAAVLANVVNNLPATLVLVPLVAPIGPAAVLAVLIGVNIGPNLTYVGSLSNLLWRSVLRQYGVWSRRRIHQARIVHGAYRAGDGGAGAVGRGAVAGSLAPALTGDFGQHHPGGHRGIQRFAHARHRDRHHRVAVLSHQPGQPLAFGSDHHHDRAGAVHIIDDRVAVGVESDELQTSIGPILQRPIEIGGTRDGDPGRRTGAGPPRYRRDRGGAPLRDQHPVAPERRDRAHDRTEVSRIGDVVQRDQQRGRRVQGRLE